MFSVGAVLCLWSGWVQAQKTLDFSDNVSSKIGSFVTTNMSKTVRGVLKTKNSTSLLELSAVF